MASLPRRRYAGDGAATSPATTNVITDPFAFSASQNQGPLEDHNQDSLNDQNDDSSSPSSSSSSSSFSSSSDSSSSSSPASSPSPFHEPQAASPFFSQPSHESSAGFHNPYAPPQAPVFQAGFEGPHQAPPSSSPFFGVSADDQPGAAVVHNYVSGSFQYNWRLVAMFLPCLFVLLSFGGQLLVNTLFGFAICWLITEFLNHKPMQIMLYWVGIYAFEVELMIIGAPLIYQNWVNFFVVSLFGMFIAILASWLTIQSQWLSVKMPAVTSILERLVMAVSLPVCATILTWATIAITGVTYAPYYLLMYLCVGFWCFSLPLPSSFRKTTSSRQLFILGRVESCAHSLILIVYPSAVNVAIYYKSILSLNGIVDILTLSSFAILFIRALKPQGSLKWIGLKGKAMDTYEVLLTFLGVVLFLGCFEYRVVFRSFHYLIHLSAPLSYILVTIGLFGLAFLFVGIAADYLKSVGKVGSIAVASVTGLSFAAVLGLPFILYPVIAGCAVLVIVLYFDRDEKMYVGAIVCGVISVSWFMQKQFWFLDVEIGWISLKGLTVVLLALFTMMMALPGLTFKASRNDLARLSLNSLLPLYALGISITENLLFINSPEIYPFYLIVFSSAVGLFLLRVIRLRVSSFSALSIWISQAVFVSKLALLAFPKYTGLAIPYSCLYVLTMTAPPLNGKHMQRQQAYVHVLGAAISSFLIRDIVSTNFLFVFFNRLPTPFLSSSMFMVLWGLACLPLSMYYFRIYNLPKQLNFLVLMVGAGTLSLQLELSVIKQLVPPQVLYSYASWLLLVFFISLLVMLFFQTTFWKVVFAAVGGPALVIAVTKSYFIFDLPAPWLIALLSIKIALVLFFFVFFAKPSPSSVKLLPIAFTFQFLLFPLLYLLANYGFNHVLGSFRKDNIYNFKYIVIALEAFAEIVLALVMKFFLQQWIPSADSPAKPLKIDADRMEIPTSSTKSGAMQRETSWIGYAANVATVTGMVVSMYWNISFLEGSEMCVLVLAPLLLLLQKDRWLFKELDVSRRYFPLVVAVSSSLVVITLLQLWLPQALSRTGSANVYALAYGLRWTISLKLKETLFLALTLPSHYYFAQWMSNYAPQSNIKWLVISPLAFLALFASLSSIKILAVLALVASLTRYILSRRFQSIGNRGV